MVPRLEARTTVRRARPELPGEQNLEFPRPAQTRWHSASIPPSHKSTNRCPRHGDRASDKRAGLSNAARGREHLPRKGCPKSCPVRSNDGRRATKRPHGRGASGRRAGAGAKGRGAGWGCGGARGRGAGRSAGAGRRLADCRAARGLPRVPSCPPPARSPPSATTCAASAWPSPRRASASQQKPLLRRRLLQRRSRRRRRLRPALRQLDGNGRYDRPASGYRRLAASTPRSPVIRAPAEAPGRGERRDQRLGAWHSDRDSHDHSLRPAREDSSRWMAEQCTLLTKGHLSEGCVVDSHRLCLMTFVQTLTEPVSGTFPLPRAGYIRDSRSRLFQNQYTQPFPSGPSVCCYPVQFTVCETVTLNSIDVQGEQQ